MDYLRQIRITMRQSLNDGLKATDVIPGKLKLARRARTFFRQYKVNKQLSETTLYEQDYLLEPGTTVGKFLNSRGVNVVKFVRYMVGEGIEKRKDDFAAEVMSQIK